MVLISKTECCINGCLTDLIICSAADLRRDMRHCSSKLWSTFKDSAICFESFRPFIEAVWISDAVTCHAPWLDVKIQRSAQLAI